MTDTSPCSNTLATKFCAVPASVNGRKPAALAQYSSPFVPGFSRIQKTCSMLNDTSPCAPIVTTPSTLCKHATPRPCRICQAVEARAAVCHSPHHVRELVDGEQLDVGRLRGGGSHTALHEPPPNAQVGDKLRADDCAPLGRQARRFCVVPACRRRHGPHARIVRSPFARAAARRSAAAPEPSPSRNSSIV